MKICGIYKITSPSGSVYIGQSVDVLSRWQSYRMFRCKAQSRLYNSLKKHGSDNHAFEIICQCERKDLNGLEIHYIKLYNTFNSEYGLNLKSGGGSPETSEETKRKISLAKKGVPQTAKAILSHVGRKEKPEVTERRRQKLLGGKLSEETKRRMSESKTGNKHHMFGKKASIETKLKQSAAKLGKASPKKGCKLSDETKQKLRDANLGKKQSKETLEKRSKSLIGHNSWSKGILWTKEQKDSQRLKKAINKAKKNDVNL